MASGNNAVMDFKNLTSRVPDYLSSQFTKREEISRRSTRSSQIKILRKRYQDSLYKMQKAFSGKNYLKIVSFQQPVCCLRRTNFSSFIFSSLSVEDSRLAVESLQFLNDFYQRTLSTSYISSQMLNIPLFKTANGQILKYYCK